MGVRPVEILAEGCEMFTWTQGGLTGPWKGELLGVLLK